MDKLDSLVAEHIADRLLQPERLEEILASILDRRQERAEPAASTSPSSTSAPPRPTCG
jgi:broad specificity phosphatase PhoE